jgi:hypothetical protein
VRLDVLATANNTVIVLLSILPVLYMLQLDLGCLARHLSIFVSVSLFVSLILIILIATLVLSYTVHSINTYGNKYIYRPFFARPGIFLTDSSGLFVSCFVPLSP